MKAEEDVKIGLRTFVPGWTLYNKHKNGADYTKVGSHKLYPEYVEAIRIILTALPWAIPLESGITQGNITGAASISFFAYSLLSLMMGINEIHYESYKHVRKQMRKLIEKYGYVKIKKLWDLYTILHRREDFDSLT